jgi:hypothetical protein
VLHWPSSRSLQSDLSIGNREKSPDSLNCREFPPQFPLQFANYARSERDSNLRSGFGLLNPGVSVSYRKQKYGGEFRCDSAVETSRSVRFPFAIQSTPKGESFAILGLKAVTLGSLTNLSRFACDCVPGGSPKTEKVLWRKRTTLGSISDNCSIFCDVISHPTASRVQLAG